MFNNINGEEFEGKKSLYCKENDNFDSDSSSEAISDIKYEDQELIPL